MNRRTKIVCTLGPAVASKEQIRGLVDAGMNVARLNFSHGEHADHEQNYNWVREATDESGAALFGKAGTIVGSSLESSNTDIADEFTKLIVTQQAYSANTKVITTTNSMVQDLLNVVR